MRHPFYPSSLTLMNRRCEAVALGLVCLGVGFLAGWFIGFDRGKTLQPDAPLEAAVVSTTTATGTVLRNVRVYESALESISVIDQKAGNTVAVAGVAFSRPGWVAVREELNGEGGRILGAAWFPEGEHEGMVGLLRATAPGNRYHAYLFLDDGDKLFDPDRDTPITKDGLLILTPFQAY